MRVESLVEKARKLKEKGMSTEEIADELNVSVDTAIWLLTRATEVPPSDIYIELRNITNPSRLRLIAAALADMVREKVDDSIDVVVGIATSGIPLATMVAEELGTDFAIYYPRKFKISEGKMIGIFSENFAKVAGKKCVIVDDVVSTGRTIKEAAENIEAAEGKVICAAVIADKRGSDEINSVQVYSLLKVLRI
ncbi:MAG: orotate phosphoribosyltransferase-like protein [Archaeoglobales archaeon]|nr:orotate phosphoribosyltransferase-like protein [Archaeoglobales archaeon]